MSALSVQKAIEIASSHASLDETREHTCTVRVEAKRCWATDGHRAIVLNVEASADQIGDYLKGSRLVHARQMPSIDAVIPREPPIALTIGKDAASALRGLSWMVNQRTTVAIKFMTEGGVAVCSLQRSTDKRAENVTVNIPDMPITRKHVVGVNLDYLLEAIEGVHAGDDVVLLQASELDPIIIKGGRGFALVMPVRP